VQTNGLNEHNPGLGARISAPSGHPTVTPVQVPLREATIAPAVRPQERRDSDHGTAETQWPSGTSNAKSTQRHPTGSRRLSDTVRTSLSITSLGVMSTPQQANGAIANGDFLRQLQDNSLQQISRKQATKQRDKDRYSTTSLKDLDLARAPVIKNQPASSKRMWAQDPLMTNGQNGEGSLGAVPARKEDSHIPQAPSQPTNQSPVLETQRTSPQATRQKWATKEEMKDEQNELDSNAWGSAAPSDATRGTNISVKSFGKMLDTGGGDFDALLPIDFDGNIMPAPADWDQRPRYSNNNATFKHRFKEWQASVAPDRLTGDRLSNGVPIIIIPKETLEDDDLIPDGLTMVRRGFAVGVANAAYYGYTDDPEDALKYAQHASPPDYRDWGKVNLMDGDNQRYKDETTEDLVSNWLQHRVNAEEASIGIGTQPKAEDKTVAVREDVAPSDEAERYSPKLNIYLRPATRLDLEELTRIYNCHVANGVGPAETDEIQTRHMAIRMRMVAEGHHAFIVAAKKNQRGAKELPLEDNEVSSRTGLLVPHKKRMTLTRVEMLAGFCCANDFTAPDFVEHISAEIEVYVDPQYRRMGVGKCLMDKMLQICDRGHRLTTHCPFHCDQELRHMYGPGGRREVHKLLVTLRKWHSPKPATISVGRGRKHRKSPFTKTTEDDYNTWLKRWLESLDFELEGYLKKTGAKQGR